MARLRMLVELRRQGTITKVAQTLHYTHSAVSQQLQKLEREAGYPLLEKVGRNVRFTQQGEILADYAEKILLLADDASVALATATDQVRGTLRVASFQTALATLAPRALNALAEDYPDLGVEIYQREVESAIEGLLRGEFDVILGETYENIDVPLPQALHREEIFSDPLRLILPRSGPLGTAVETMSDLAQYPWAIDPAHLIFGRWAREYCRGYGFEPRVLFETPDPFLQIYLAREGHAVTIVPALLAAHFRKEVQVLPLAGKPSRTLYSAVRNGHENSPAIRVFRAAVAEAARDLSPLTSAYGSPRN
ncbi:MULTISPECIES: LysR family transcriptional regulator [unclassified Corynebacterium]|uniref:LysR family transcriptional regulator n=1 Tax=unclassified Corynebacterium TaxID=2624378 RepID=UPI0029CA62FA|nr:MULTISPECIES: LysR family transcriptional regulator [unclassified Corynebacterium]WPF65113.1 LysR family transcriptional regulator [Corynebacterium sp. 22KM0430]WPF67609.1 LysR family transcriptional regulator [Corynebacterium sp. 21KM1197]